MEQTNFKLRLNSNFNLPMSLQDAVNRAREVPNEFRRLRLLKIEAICQLQGGVSIYGDTELWFVNSHTEHSLRSMVSQMDRLVASNHHCSQVGSSAFFIASKLHDNLKVDAFSTPEVLKSLL